MYSTQIHLTLSSFQAVIFAVGVAVSHAASLPPILSTFEFADIYGKNVLAPLVIPEGRAAALLTGLPPPPAIPQAFAAVPDTATPLDEAAPSAAAAPAPIQATSVPTSGALFFKAPVNRDFDDTSSAVPTKVTSIHRASSNFRSLPPSPVPLANDLASGPPVFPTAFESSPEAVPIDLGLASSVLGDSPSFRSASLPDVRVSEEILSGPPVFKAPFEARNSFPRYCQD